MLSQKVEGLPLQVGGEAYMIEEEKLMEVGHPLILENNQIVDLS
jgi:hypothetical protein